MESEKVIRALILTHASFGGIALLAGLAALIVKKGKSVHKKAGKVFYYSMLFSALSALIISVLPNHESPFLFAVGVFSSYFILTGYRALNYKMHNPALTVDRTLSWIMILVGITMILYPLLLDGSVNVVLLVFGVVGIFFASRDFRLYKDPKRLKKGWLKLHLGKMIGGYISAATAFVVVNEFFPGVYGWFIPGIIGGFYIAYWMMKINRKPVANSTPKAMAGSQGN